MLERVQCGTAEPAPLPMRINVHKGETSEEGDPIILLNNKVLIKVHVVIFEIVYVGKGFAQARG
jgi:hypothetical protein